MAQITTYELTEDWVDFEDVIDGTAESEKLYYIQNRGNDYLIACEGIEEPTTEAGVIVPPRSVLKYVVGSQALYLKSKNGVCLINVSIEG